MEEKEMKTQSWVFVPCEIDGKPAQWKMTVDQYNKLCDKYGITKGVLLCNRN